jgi:hypothetical protein
MAIVMGVPSETRAVLTGHLASTQLEVDLPIKLTGVRPRLAPDISCVKLHYSMASIHFSCSSSANANLVSWYGGMPRAENLEPYPGR